jgi:transposase
LYLSPKISGKKRASATWGIGHGGFTISDNSETDKTAMTTESVKGEEIERTREPFGNGENKVRGIGTDMGPTCPNVSELKFRNATTAIDKCRVMRYAYDAVCDVRTRIKKEIPAGLSNGKRKTPEDKLVTKDPEPLPCSGQAAGETDAGKRRSCE